MHRLPRLDRGTVALLLLLAFCLACDMFIARAQIPNSDFTMNYRELFAIRDGNILLKNWLLTSDSFIFTELPVSLLLSLFLGTSFAIIYLGPFFIFAGLLITALLIAAGASPTRNARLLSQFTILFLFGIPFSPCAEMLLNGSIHIGSILFALLIILTAQPALMGRDLNKWRLIPFGSLMFAGSASDPLFSIFCALPFLLLIALRFWQYRKFQQSEWQLAGVTCLALALAAQFRPFITAHGGFATAPNYSTSFIPALDGLLTSLAALNTGMSALFSAYPPLAEPSPIAPLMTAIRTLTELITAALAASISWHAPVRRHSNGVSQFLILAALVLLSFDSLSSYFNVNIILNGKFEPTGTRFIIPAFIFLCLAAALELPVILPYLKRKKLTRLGFWFAALAAVLFFAQAGLHTAPALTSPAAYQATPELRLAQWLEQSGLSYGVGPYWTAELTQALSQNHIIIDPVRANQPQTEINPYIWECDAASLINHRRPQFAVFPPANAFGLTIADLTAAYGPAKQILNVYGFYVMEFAN